MLWAALGVLVNSKLADGVAPTAEAITAKLPAVSVAVKGTLTWPLASVVASAVLTPSGKVPLALEAGVVKVTETPETGPGSRSSAGWCSV
jgi:hypothetical protein